MRHSQVLPGYPHSSAGAYGLRCPLYAHPGYATDHSTFCYKNFWTCTGAIRDKELTVESNVVEFALTVLLLPHVRAQGVE